MNFFITSICLCLLTCTFLVCGQDKEDNETKRLLDILNSLNNNQVEKLEKQVTYNISYIGDILRGKINDVNRERVIYQLSFVFGDMLISQVNKNRGLQKFMKEVFLPDYIPNRFYCAWLTIVEFIEEIYRKESIIESYSYSRRYIYKIADEATGNNESSIIKRKLHNHEFVAVLKTKAPDLDDTLIAKILEHPVENYHFQKKEYFYCEDVLIGFLGWINFIDQQNDMFKYYLVVELKKTYTESGWFASSRNLALILSRDHYMGNHIKNKFWLNYQQKITQKVQQDFEEILNEAFAGGWYYTEDDIKYLRLVETAWMKEEPKHERLEIQFESLLQKTEVRLPQSPRCTFTRRDLKDLFLRWSTSSTNSAKNGAV